MVAARGVGSRVRAARPNVRQHAGEMHMDADTLEDALVHARSLLVDLQRHIDRAAVEHDVAEVARAWVRAVQVERSLRSLLPPEATANVDVTDDKAPTSP
jgi:hypothetical protein